MTPIVDFHTHAFPDQLAARAVPALAEKGNVRPRLNGTTGDLLNSMDLAGIERSVICSIATRPEQFDSIVAWSATIRSVRLIPLPSVHPDDPLVHDRIRIIREEGFKGIKLHPYYQDFFLDEPRMMRIYESVNRHDLLLVMHTGFDIAFPRIRRADPQKIIAVTRRFPDLKLITTHLGGWDDWDEVRRKLIGRPIYMDLSFSLHYLPPSAARRLLLDHPADHLLFGSDSPWEDQARALQLLRNLALEKSIEEKILWKNAHRLLKACRQR